MKKTSWNSGLTKENDKRVREHGDSLSEKYKTGLLKPSWSGRHHSEESKEKMRRKRFDFLKKRTGETAWERRASRKMSFLEQWFFDNVILEHNLTEKYDIVNEYAQYPYFIDFAFLNIKLAVELDGACHFKNGKERIEHDKKKDAALIENGWSIFRIKFDEANDETIRKFLTTITGMKAGDKIYSNGVVNYKEHKVKKTRSMKEFRRQRSEQYEKNQRELIDLILNSNIDFSKYGWASLVSQIIRQKPQKVNSWMRRFMPEFFEDVCFKRVSRQS